VVTTITELLGHLLERCNVLVCQLVKYIAWSHYIVIAMMGTPFLCKQRNELWSSKKMKRGYQIKILYSRPTTQTVAAKTSVSYHAASLSCNETFVFSARSSQPSWRQMKMKSQKIGGDVVSGDKSKGSRGKVCAKDIHVQVLKHMARAYILSDQCYVKELITQSTGRRYYSLC
jgi:hypothetical protein